MSAIVTIGKMLPAILEAVDPILDRLFPGRAGKQIKDMIHKQLAENAGKQLDFAAEWLRMDSKHDAWFYSAWRPALAWTCIAVVVVWLLINPLLTLIFDWTIPAPNLKAIPDQVWHILLASVGLYIPARSYDKRTRAMTDQRPPERVEVPVYESQARSRRTPVDDEGGYFTPTPRTQTRRDRERKITE